jgi:hypothetical protein
MLDAADPTASPGAAERSATLRDVAYRALAIGLVATHAAVSLFIVFGGLLVWHGLAPLWLQVSLAAWGVLTFVGNMTCPLTPLEKWLRRRARLPTYDTGFVERYMMPRSLRGRVSRSGHVMVGLGVLAANALIYGTWLLTG